MKTANPCNFTEVSVDKNIDMPPRRRGDQSETLPTETVSIDSLRSADSPRLAGENSEHTRTLAESEAVLPPIIVHSRTLRVIDGVHRLQAAKLRGQKTIEVQFHDGDEADIFALAVERNIAHGLPLSRSDRTAAAARIVGSHPHWSDRKIASITGLSATTIGAIRMRSAGNARRPDARIGRDGRIRPINSTAGRELATKLIEAQPDAAIRDIAAAAGISPSTAQDVRTRLRNGHNPLPGTDRDRPPATQPVRTGQPCAQATNHRSLLQGLEWEPALRRLRRDPSLRFTEAGRTLLRLLDTHLIGAQRLTRLTPRIPAHCTTTIAELARLTGNRWHEFADQLNHRAHTTSIVDT